MPKSTKLSATRILTTVNEMRRQLWPIWMMERGMVAYYNGGAMPTLSSEEVCDEDAPVSLGLGNRYIKKPFDSLMDTILMDPGFIKTEVRYPLKAERKQMIEGALDTELNAILHPRMESTFRSIAGRALITGRAFMFRLSRWDWKFRSGRLLHPFHYSDDILDESWREWAFMGQITLRELDEKIANTREYEGAGWDYAAMRNLKEYILKLTDAEKKESSEEFLKRMNADFPEDVGRSPLDVYWYFRKSDTERDHNGQSKVDLYCVSRHGYSATVVEQQQNAVTFKALEIKHGGADGNQVLYYMPNAFENIEECLIALLLDARVDGEQEMGQVDGTGKVMVNRLANMEGLATSVLEGVAFAVQPNWTSTNGSGVTEKMIEDLSREGLGPWDYVPPGMKPMDKNNALTNINGAMSMLSMLGMSAEADGGTGEMSPLGESQARFKNESDKLIQAAQSQVGRRFSRFAHCLDKLACQQKETLCRPLTLWRKGDAGYWEARKFQVDMATIHKIMPAEYSSERVFARARKINGEMERGQAVQKAVGMLTQFGGQYSPEGVRVIVKEATRAAWGDPMADILMPDKPKDVPTDQMAMAVNQNSMCIVCLLPVQRGSADNPLMHIPIHEQALQARLAICIQQGSISAAEQKGLGLLLMHLAEDVVALPKAAQMQLAPVLRKAAMTIQQLPVQGAQTEMGLKQMDQARKDKQLEFMQQREANLQGDRDRKLGIAQNKLFLDMRRLLNEEKTTGVSRAAQLLSMLHDANDQGRLDQQHGAFMQQTAHDMQLGQQSADIQQQSVDIQQQQVDQAAQQDNTGE